MLTLLKKMIVAAVGVTDGPIADNAPQRTASARLPKSKICALP